MPGKVRESMEDAGADRIIEDRESVLVLEYFR